DATMHDVLTLPDGSGPGAIRMMDSCLQSGGLSDQHSSDELQSPALASWSSVGSPLKTVPIASIRPLTTSLSPSIIAPGEVIPIPTGWPQNGAAYFWGGVCVGEAVCAVPHDFGTGQMAAKISLKTPSVTIAYGGGTVVPMPDPCPTAIYVTSPTTFMFVFGA